MNIIPISSININSKGSCGYCEKGLEGKWAISGFQTALISVILLTNIGRGLF